MLARMLAWRPSDCGVIVMAKVLTERFVSTLKAPPEGRRLTVFDSRQPGLCIRVTSTGNRSFYVVSRAPAGKQRWAEVRDGNAPVTSLARARELAPAGVANIKNGREAFPRIEAEPEKDAYETVVARFVKQYAEPRQRTWKETARILNATPWGKRPFGEITKKDAIAYLDGLVAEGKRATAAITLRWLKTLWRWAARRDLVASPVMDPLSAEQDFAIIPIVRDRVYSDAELKALWNATGRLSAKERAYLKLWMLAGSRAGALGGMRRSELD
ncbi:MAG: DUF4102 domain-containing protein, partial [Alphaproteobacteria bacterium]|nr:DUF4102 domain-containing protein [Alphaproteobacteria bacterium]